MTPPVTPALAAMRFAVGAAAWLAPEHTTRLFALGATNNQPFVTQLFGSRDVALALAITDTATPQLRTRALQLGVLADVLDTIAAARSYREGKTSALGTLLGGGGAAFFAGLGLTALVAQSRERTAHQAPGTAAHAQRRRRRAGPRIPVMSDLLRDAAIGAVAFAPSTSTWP